MKKLIFTSTTWAIAMSIILPSCGSLSQKPTEESRLESIENDSTYTVNIVGFIKNKEEILSIIVMNEAKIAELGERMNNEKGDAKIETQNIIAKLKKENIELKKKLADLEVKEHDEWKNNDIDFDQEIQELDTVITNSIAKRPSSGRD